MSNYVSQAYGPCILYLSLTCLVENRREASTEQKTKKKIGQCDETSYNLKMKI